MLGFDAVQSLGKLGSLLPHRRIEDVFLRMVHGVGVHGHIAHDVVDEFVIRLVAVPDPAGLALEQVEHKRHVAMVFTQVAENVCHLNRHVATSIEQVLIDGAGASTAR